MFGSLVVVYPTAHTGGVLQFTKDKKSWSLDSGADLAEKESSIAYAVFFSDVDHEVLPVTSGHRVTVTYNLHREPTSNWKAKGGSDTSSEDDESEDDEAELAGSPSNNGEGKVYGASAVSFRDDEAELTKMLRSLLDDPEFLPKGGMMGFGLSYKYAVQRVYGKIPDVLDRLKGIDAALFRACDALGLRIKCKAFSAGDGYYKQWLLDDIPIIRYQMHDTDEPLDYILGRYGAALISNDGDDDSDREEELGDRFVWVTRPTQVSRTGRQTYATYGNEVGLCRALVENKTDFHPSVQPVTSMLISAWLCTLANTALGRRDFRCRKQQGSLGGTGTTRSAIIFRTCCCSSTLK
jgi:hypothetical protein